MPEAHEGDVHYVEHVTDDPKRMRLFLERAHGWRFEAMGPELGGSYVAVLPNGTRVGVRAPMSEQEKPLTRTYVRVKDAEAAVKRAEEMGAEIAGHGKIAIWFLGGVELGVWETP